MNQTKEVDFKTYCPLCEHFTKPENEDPCWDCLDQGWNVDSKKPLYFIEKKETKK